MQRIHGIIADIAPHDSVERYTGLGVEVLQGYAKIVNPWTVEIALNDGSKQTLTTRSIVIAAGAQPFVPPLPGLDDVGYVTSDTLWDRFAELDAAPKRLVVLGGGPIGCELAQSFARLGSAVTQVEMAPRIMGREDEEVSALAAAALQADGVQVLTSHKALRCERRGDEKVLVVEHAGVEKAIAFDELLCAVGRSARLTGYGLEELGIPTQKTVQTNEYLQTIYPNIFAAGDVAGPYQFTHVAAHQAWYAAVNALFGDFKKFKADYSVIPWATFIDPEVARVGLNEQDAKEKGIAYEVTQVRYRRPGPRHCRQRSPRLCQGADRAGQGQNSGRDHCGQPRGRAAGRVRAGHAPRPGAEQDFGHHPHLPHAVRGQQVRGRRVEAGPPARGPAGMGAQVPHLAARLEIMPPRSAAARVAAPPAAQSLAMQTASSPIVRDIVLVGGGHSHVGVLRYFAMHPLPGVRLTVVCTDAHTPYSGMLPGYVAGHYTYDEVHIDLCRLCAAIGARFIQAEVTGLDRTARTVLLRDRPALRYDLVSINTGSTPQTQVTGAAAIQRAGQTDHRLQPALAGLAGARAQPYRDTAHCRGGRGRRRRRAVPGHAAPAAEASFPRPPRCSSRCSPRASCCPRTTPACAAALPPCWRSAAYRCTPTPKSPRCRPTGCAPRKVRGLRPTKCCG